MAKKKNNSEESDGVEASVGEGVGEVIVEGGSLKAAISNIHSMELLRASGEAGGGGAVRNLRHQTFGRGRICCRGGSSRRKRQFESCINIHASINFRLKSR